MSWSNEIFWGFIQGNQIIGAIIQALGTILAALIAVISARRALHAWKTEAPGRRQMEIAEETWILFYKLHKEISNTLINFQIRMNMDFAFNKILERDIKNWVEELGGSFSQISTLLNNLGDSMARLEIYGVDTTESYQAIGSYYREVHSTYLEIRFIAAQPVFDIENINRLYKKIMSEQKAQKLV